VVFVEFFIGYSPPSSHLGPYNNNALFCFIRGLTRGASEHHRLIRAPEMTLPVSALPETDSVGRSQQTNSTSRPRPRNEVSDTGNSPPHPTPASDAAFPLVRSRPPVMSPTFSSQPVEQARMDRGQIMTLPPIIVAVDHYTSHTVTVYTIQACATPF
jgi:hypothetical protein